MNYRASREITKIAEELIRDEDGAMASLRRTIPLTGGYEALVDAADFEELSRWTWIAKVDGRSSDVYARRVIKIPDPSKKSGHRQVTVYMSRYLLGLGRDDARRCDHINGDTLDNRRRNLRAATIQQNAMNRAVNKNNTSGHAGVSWNCGKRAWESYIKVNRKQICLGHFDTLDEAVFARGRAEARHFGEFARQMVSHQASGKE